MASLTLAFFIIQYLLINEYLSLLTFLKFYLFLLHFSLSCIFNDNSGLKCLLRSTDIHETDHTSLSLAFFFPPQYFIWSRPHISFRSFFFSHSNLEECYVRGICVSCFLKLITNHTQLVICLTCYVYIITSREGYKNHTLEPLTKIINKQVDSLQKQCSFHIFMIGTSTDTCFRYWDGSEWQ